MPPLYNLRKGLKKVDDRFDYIIYENGRYVLQQDAFFCVHTLYSPMLAMLSNTARLSRREITLMAGILEYYKGEYLLGIYEEWAGKSKTYYEMLYERAALRVSAFYIENDECNPRR